MKQKIYILPNAKGHKVVDFGNVILHSEHEQDVAASEGDNVIRNWHDTCNFIGFSAHRKSVGELEVRGS